MSFKFFIPVLRITSPDHLVVFGRSSGVVRSSSLARCVYFAWSITSRRDYSQYRRNDATNITSRHIVHGTKQFLRFFFFFTTIPHVLYLSSGLFCRSGFTLETRGWAPQPIPHFLPCSLFLKIVSVIGNLVLRPSKCHSYEK